MWIVENGVQMHPRHPFYGRLTLKAETDSNSSWTGIPACVEHPCWSSTPFFKYFMTLSNVAKQDNVIS